MNTAELVLKETQSLPEVEAREVLDFVLFLKERSGRRQWDDLMGAQAESLEAVWDNAADEVWNDV